MARYDIDQLKTAVICPALLENDGWKVDLRESTPKAIKYRRSEGEIIIVVHNGRGWFDPTSDAKGDVFSLAQRLGSPDFASAVKAVADLIGFEQTAPAWQARDRARPPRCRSTLVGARSSDAWIFRLELSHKGPCHS